MATSIAATRAALFGSIGLQTAPRQQSNHNGSLPLVWPSLGESQFLAGARGVPAGRLRSHQLTRQKQTARAAIVPERAVSAAEVKWDAKRKVLVDANVRSVAPKEARRLIDEQGYRFLDVRPDYDYKEAHPEDSSNVQLYRAIQDWTPYKIIRRAGFAFFGIFKGTEENPSFIEDVRATFPEKDAKIIVACTAGGSTRPSANFPEGKQSRSLIAAYYLVVDGYKNVLHLDNGLMAYFSEELPANFGNDN